MIRNKVKETRIDKDISQKKLAEIAGITRQSLHAIESGRSSPSLEVAIKISKFLGYKLETLFWIDEDPEIFTLFDHKLVKRK